MGKSIRLSGDSERFLERERERERREGMVNCWNVRRPSQLKNWCLLVVVLQALLADSNKDQQLLLLFCETTTRSCNKMDTYNLNLALSSLPEVRVSDEN